MNKDRLINTFLEMVRIDSESKNEADFSKYLTNELNKLGFEVSIDNAGSKSYSNTGNIIAKLKGTLDVPTVLFCAHMDTVSPGNNIKPIIRDNIIYSDGTTVLGSDDKAGIATIIEAINHIKENNILHGDIELVFTICEEIGLLGSKNLDYSKLNSKIAFVLDSSGDVGNIIMQGPAQTKIDATIFGKAAHAGIAPENGINAIAVASEAIANMKLLRIDNETTANIGTINGGIATNIVCDKVEIKMEARSLKREKRDAQTKHMVDCIYNACDKYNTKCDVDVKLCYPEFVIDEQDAILNIVKSAMNRVGIPFNLKSTGGGSDTNIFNSNGLKAVTIAIGMSNVHTNSEFITIDSLVKTSELVISLIQEVK